MDRHPTIARNKGDAAYFLVGSVPAALTVERHVPFTTPRVSITWATEQEAIDALLALGVSHFRRHDCTWYDQVQGAGDATYDRAVAADAEYAARRKDVSS